MPCFEVGSGVLGVCVVNKSTEQRRNYTIINGI